jgi:hypothetical protein
MPRAISRNSSCALVASATARSSWSPRRLSSGGTAACAARSLLLDLREQLTHQRGLRHTLRVRYRCPPTVCGHRQNVHRDRHPRPVYSDRYGCQQVPDVVVLGPQMPLVHRGDERQLVHVRQDRPVLVMGHLAVPAPVAQPVDRLQRPAVGHLGDREVELLPRCARPATRRCLASLANRAASTVSSRRAWLLASPLDTPPGTTGSAAFQPEHQSGLRACSSPGSALRLLRAS